MSCRPPANATYLAIGQDLFSINEYVTEQYNYSLHRESRSKNSIGGAGGGLSISSFVPSAFMVYTDLATLSGLWSPTDYGSGVEYADGLLDLFPPKDPDGRRDAGLQVGLWLDGSRGCLALAAGEMDGQIDLLASWLGRSRAARIFLRVGYEFDNPAFGYGDDPGLYALAFRRVVAGCRERLGEESLGRVLFVWHSWAAPVAGNVSLEDFYPGDEFVDWIGVSIFQQVLPWSPYWGGRMADVERVLDFAREHGKPTMIAESTPFGGIELGQVSDDARSFLDDNEYDHNDWDRWFGRVIDVIDRHNVSMWCYINCDWEGQPMWRGVGFGETRLSTSPRVMERWHEGVVGNKIAGRTFLGAGSLKGCGEDVPAVADAAEAGPGRPFDPTHFYSFILVPFLVASGAFFVPYFVLGGYWHRARHVRPTGGERRPLLSGLEGSDTALSALDGPDAASPVQVPGSQGPAANG